jgi:hypothetical protein
MEVVSVQHWPASSRSYLPRTCAFASKSALGCSPNTSSQKHKEQLKRHLSSVSYAPMDTHSSLRPSRRVIGEVAIVLSSHKCIDYRHKPLQTCHE